MIKYIANIITLSRILGSILLLFFPAFSLGFYIIYLLCGFSDMIDGTIARKTNSAGKFGEKLDTIADLIFVAVSFFKVLPSLHIPAWIWVWCGGIGAIKIGNILVGYASQKQFLSLHTIMNKIAGFLLFLLPFTLHFIELKYSFIFVCSVATIAAMQESFLLKKRLIN